MSVFQFWGLLKQIVVHGVEGEYPNKGKRVPLGDQDGARSPLLGGSWVLITPFISVLTNLLSPLRRL